MNNNTIDKEVFAVISHALHQEIARNMHDIESYKLTIKQNKYSAWALKTELIRKAPNR